MPRMNNALRCGTLVAFLVLASACADGFQPGAPTSVARYYPPGWSHEVPRNFPAVSRPARVYVAVDAPEYEMHGSPLASRYVLYTDGTFALQYSSVKYPFFEYRGSYKEEDALITFEWENPGAPGRWVSTGSLRSDALSVQYNDLMAHSDFLDGVYVRTH